MTSRPLDTAPDAWARHNDVLDGMDGPARVRAAMELSDVVREIRLAGLRARHPGLSPRAVVARLVAEDHGIDLPSET
ncbi:MAG: hypothetical protein RQ751_07100 [Longimicrobiales bacterium]|nr:hypothetical protein [Longimicrobiales bacterium]